MRAVDLIRQKRDGGVLDRAAIDSFVTGVTDGTLPDYQTSALLMAILLRGMTPDETARADRRDGAVGRARDLSAAGDRGTPVDKHSTGGVGDKTSLVLAPLAAACGAYVPMMSGRGLGHTGGTLDKLEAIPGFRTGLSLDELKAAVSTIGCALIGQTSEIAPADRKLYALRDVTATVESIPLICASIMSKKIAEGIGGLVLDVKTGTGAFMKTPEASRALAESLVAIGRAAGVRTEALITRMDAPLGREVGNASEVDRVDRDAQGPRPGRSRGAVGAAGGAHAGRRRRGARRRGRRGAGARGDSPRGRASRSFARSSSIRAATRASSTTTRGCRRRRIARSSPRRRSGFVAGLEAEPSAARPSRSAPGAAASTTSSTTASGLPSSRRRAPRCAPAIGSW